MPASGCNTPGTTDSTEPTSVLQATIHCSCICGWRCSKPKIPRFSMKATLIGGAAFSLLTVSAFGADLGTDMRFKAPPVAPPFTWTSCYGGFHAGGSMGQKTLTDTAGVLSPLTGFTSANLDIAGYMVGGQIGCDY